MTLDELTVAVYKQRLEQTSDGAVQRMLERDNDEGIALRTRAMSYRPIVAAVLAELLLDP